MRPGANSESTRRWSTRSVDGCGRRTSDLGRHGGTSAHLRGDRFLGSGVARGSGSRRAQRPFEDAFLSAEFAQSWYRCPGYPCAGHLPLAQSFVPTPNHRLATVCAWGGVTIDGPHTALGDARATAQVLPRLLASRRSAPGGGHGFSRLGGVMGGGYLPRARSGGHGPLLWRGRSESGGQRPGPNLLPGDPGAEVGD